MAAVFQVMALGVRALDKRDVDPAYMAKLAKIATTEMISSKVHCCSLYFSIAIFLVTGSTSSSTSYIFVGAVF